MIFSCQSLCPTLLSYFLHAWSGASTVSHTSPHPPGLSAALCRLALINRQYRRERRHSGHHAHGDTPVYHPREVLCRDETLTAVAVAVDYEWHPEPREMRTNSDIL